jgi:hypothetical protein
MNTKAFDQAVGCAARTDIWCAQHTLQSTNSYSSHEEHEQERGLKDNNSFRVFRG